MPFIAGNFDVLAANLFTTASNNAIKANIVLKRIGADDVVVVTIKDTHSNSTRLIDASSDRFEPYGDINVLGDDWFSDSPFDRRWTVQSLDLQMMSHR